MFIAVALFTRAWIEMQSFAVFANRRKSPSSRGRGLKSYMGKFILTVFRVALFTRAWIEMRYLKRTEITLAVALFTRAWIEILVAP